MRIVVILSLLVVLVLGVEQQRKPPYDPTAIGWVWLFTNGAKPTTADLDRLNERGFHHRNSTRYGGFTLLTTSLEQSSWAANHATTHGAISHTHAGALFERLIPHLVKSTRASNVLISADYPVTISGATSSWALDRIDQRTLPLNGQFNLPAGVDGTGVHIYMVDTGIDTAHSDFGGRASLDFSAFATFTDDNGHGTHTAGLAGGFTWGVAKNVFLHSIKVLDSTGSGTVSTVVAGLMYVIANAQFPALVSMSLASPSFSSPFNSAVQTLWSMNIISVCAAGNNAGDACANFPAGFMHAVAVAATDSTDTIASFSNFGTCVDLLAPGVSVTSDWNNGATQVLSGTSMSTPLTTGSFALLWQQQPGWTAQQIVTNLLNDATVGVVIGLDVTTPNRLLYAANAISSSPAPPPPTPSPPSPVPPPPPPPPFSASPSISNAWSLQSNLGTILLLCVIYFL